MRKIILASASLRRKILLKKIVSNFVVVPSRVQESKISYQTPEGLAVKAALAKALKVALRKKDSVVIGADTIVVLGKKIFGKPKNNKVAMNMLRSLLGRTHSVITGIAVVDLNKLKIFADFEKTKVKMKKVAKEEIQKYVESGKPLDKAGAYGIQEIEGIFVEKVIGDYDNVVGLPIKKLKMLLKKVVPEIIR